MKSNWMLTALGNNSAIDPFRALINLGAMGYRQLERLFMSKSPKPQSRKGQPVGRRPHELRAGEPPNADTGGKSPKQRYISASLSKLDLSDGDVILLRFPKQVSQGDMARQAESLRDLIDRKVKIVCVMEPFDIEVIPKDVICDSDWTMGPPPHEIANGVYILTWDNDNTPCIAIKDEHAGWIHYPGGWSVTIERWRAI